MTAKKLSVPSFFSVGVSFDFRVKIYLRSAIFSVFKKGVGFVSYIGIGIISLFSFVATSFLCNIVLKRKMGEAMMWGVIVLLIIGTCFDGKNLWCR